MFISLCRAFEHDLPGLRSMPSGTLAATLLRLVAVAARRAVAQPVAGTILTVADDAAWAAEEVAARQPGDALAVVQASREGARESLARTPEQLDVLASAGVVDAGGQAYVLLLDVLAEILGGAAAQPLRRHRRGRPSAGRDVANDWRVRGDVHAARGSVIRSGRVARPSVRAWP